METPEFFQSGCYDAQFAPEECLSDVKNGDHFAVDEFLDFHVDEKAAEADGGLEAAMTGDSSAVAAVDSSSFCGGGLPAETHFNAAGGQFASELCVPYDDVAELEWLSNFVEESFSSEDLQKLQGTNDRNTDTSGTQQYHFQPEITKPAPKLQPAPPVRSKAARTKRSRAAPVDWTSRLLVVTPTPPPNTPIMSPPPESELAAAKKASKPRKGLPENPSGGGDGRRCLHCDTDKTPQWRTGPLGPKTLCNACGVRYKSGRLVPEYRPAASPTFVVAKHSNSHRKVLELRRQKEVQGNNQVQQPFLHQQSMMFDDDYLIHQHVGPDFTQLI